MAEEEEKSDHIPTGRALFIQEDLGSQLLIRGVCSLGQALIWAVRNPFLLFILVGFVLVFAVLRI
jgi:hypothetical protein